MMIFAAGLQIEREPLRWAGVPEAIASYLQDVGLIAMVALLIWGVAYALRARQGAVAFPPRWTATAVLFAGCFAGAALLYGVFLALLGIQGLAPEYTPAQLACLTVAGGLALAAAAVAPLTALLRDVRWRRVWALARLSIKEATRGRVLYVFLILPVVLLFAGYFVTSRPEDQVRTYVAVVYWSLSALLIVVAALVGSFSIPQDVSRQTIHTVVTKPVERYEIVLGRFLGYGILVTAGVFALSALSLLFVSRGVTRQAAQESYKARVTLVPDELTYQEMDVYGRVLTTRGENVGREWDYRRYIRGRPPQATNMPRQFAIFSFASLPASLADRKEPVRFEFTFDIYRTTKQEKGKEGVECTLVLADGRMTVPEIRARVKAAEKERQDLVEREKRRDRAEEEAAETRQKIDEHLVRRHGVHEASGVLVLDYQTRHLKVPAGLFRALAEVRQQRTSQGDESAEPAPALKVVVSISEDDPVSRQQMVGMARRDLYLLEGELPFGQNFFKGMFGLWFTVLLVLGIAIAASTYLSGVISLLCTVFLFGSGLFLDYVRSLAEGRLEGGGPTAAATRLFYALPIAAPLEQSPVRSLGEGIDQAYAWLLRFVLKMIPDVDRFNLTAYVANGFDISWGVLLWHTFLYLAGYLLPCAILAYYLINSREVANPS